MYMRQRIEQEAFRLGFTACGFAKAEPVEEEAVQVLDHWVEQGYHAGMGYMERNRELRLDPTLLVPGCRTLIVVALNYYPQQLLPKEGYQIAYYAYGKDYHRVVKDKLHQLFAYIRTLVPEVKGRAFCDTAPLLERYWAVKAGLGFIGRNRTLIIPGQGSYCFLGVLAIDAQLDVHAIPSTHAESTCMGCKRCLLACPTGALTADGIDCRRCLSYLTIEHRGAFPREVAGKLGRRIYGCDTCQQVCPHNSRAVATDEPSFALSPHLEKCGPADWEGMTQEQYEAMTQDSAMERVGYEGMRRNIDEAARHLNRQGE